MKEKKGVEEKERRLKVMNKISSWLRNTSIIQKRYLIKLKRKLLNQNKIYNKYLGYLK